MHVKLGPLALYIEDAYVTALTEIYRLAVPHNTANVHDLGLTQAKILQCPLRFRSLCIHSLDLTLTLHTAVRIRLYCSQCILSFLCCEIIKYDQYVNISDAYVHSSRPESLTLESISTTKCYDIAGTTSACIDCSLSLRDHSWRW